MKKFLRYYLPIIIIFICLGCYLFSDRDNTLKCVTNKKECRIVSTTRNAVIKIDGVESDGSKIFEDEKNFYLITDYYRKNNFHMMIIDKSRKDVTLTISCYEVMFSKYLLLPDCANDFFYSSPKIGFNTQLKLTDSNISFVLPDSANFSVPKYNIEILFKGE